MSQMAAFVEKGGIVLGVLILLSLLLYERCFTLLIRLRWWRGRLRDAGGDAETRAVLMGTMEESFERRLITIKTLTAAAPLLGLLGTVIGMLQMFASITDRVGERSVQGLADGISLALVTTETGLAVAIPALLLVSWAERQMNKSFAEVLQ